MKRQLQLFASLILILFAFSACENDDDKPADLLPGYEKPGVLIVNEGNFGSGNGSLSWYNTQSQEISKNIFESGNESRKISASIQSVTWYKNTAYLLCNKADKIEVVNEKTYQALQAPIEDEQLVSPRYFAGINNKGFVTVWGAFDENYTLPESKVAVIDLENHSIKKFIDVPSGPEGIIALNDKIYIANSYTDIVTIIDPSTEAIVKKLKTNTSPKHFAVDKNGQLWVISTGGFAGGTPQLQRINPETDEIEHSIDLAGTQATGNMAINGSKDKIYFLGAEAYPSTTTHLFAVDITATEGPETSLLSGENYYGLGIAPNSGDIYIADSNNYQGEGSVLIFNASGEAKNTIASGVLPNSFLFKF
ncbi:DUF5074 domain-containing protein [Rapidithrix thailandica]|uniref:DUF5074 domain-containing protein n=1 Tax=Rapidithrix thailandica TaxID=413964 RepID=A0AAW9RS06_9BACT